MLPNRTKIHTFRNSGFMLIGADWQRRILHAAMRKYGVELSGEQATAMKHGLVLIDDHGPLFIETREQKPPEERDREERAVRG